MPRKLPWQVQPGRSTDASGLKRLSSNPKPIPKRVKLSEPSSDIDEEDSEVRPAASKEQVSKSTRGRAPSTSPPPEPPAERLMVEGLEDDDKYRMVEDEFLDIAKRFTVHLHAAEYKRQKRMAKAKNADAIDSISRPVTGKMPDHTKRKAESVAKSKMQRNALKDLLRKKPGDAEDSDDSDDDKLPYIGTSLYPLMASPKGKSMSLAKVRPFKAATRNAAGYHTPTARSKDWTKIKTSPSESPKPKGTRIYASKHDDKATASEDDDDDDLDAPIKASKPLSFDRKPPGRGNLESSRPLPKAAKVNQSSAYAQMKKEVGSSDMYAPTETTTSFRPGPKPLIFNPPVAIKPEPDSSAETAQAQADSEDRVARRREQYRRQRAKDKEEEKKKGEAVIPMFLG